MRFCGCSIDEFERELNLTRCASGPADFAEARAAENIRGQAHIHDVEEIEELRSELEIHLLSSAVTMAEWRALDESEIVIVVSRSAESVAPQRAEQALVGTGASRYVNRNGEEVGPVVCAFAKVVLAICTRCGEMRRCNLVGPIDAVRSRAGLLDAGEYGERRSRADA